tara:strand:- start:343 stop:474 length:132 start_codon:yes stop_codon:yes gene_type:complete
VAEVVEVITFQALVVLEQEVQAVVVLIQVLTQKYQERQVIHHL